MQPPKISINEESLTPVTLAKKLKENPDALLKELKDEKGLFQDTMQANTILAWDTIQRACERRGYEVIENYQPSEETALSKREKEALQHCISFHKMYADLIVESLPKEGPDQRTTSKLAEYHREISKAIHGVLEKVQKQEKNVSPRKEVGINNFL
jgi:hypothetical protein